MSKHRSTQVRVQNTSRNRNFEAGTALENLRAEMTDVEALARAAEAAADALPRAGHRASAPRVRPYPVARHQDVAAGERLAALRERPGHRIHRAAGHRSRSPRSRVSDSVAAESKSVGSRRNA